MSNSLREGSQREGIHISRSAQAATLALFSTAFAASGCITIVNEAPCCGTTPEGAKVTATPRPTEQYIPPAMPTPTAKPVEVKPTPENITMPPFAIYGVQGNITLDRNDSILPNNGPDAEGNDHKATHLPTNPVVADPGHYRVDNITNVTDPTTRATIERDVKNGAAYAGDDYKDVLTEKTADVPLMEAGGAAMITTDHAELSFVDASGNTVTIQCGSKPNNGYVIVVQNGLDRDHIRDTDANRTLHVGKYDTAWTMWQGVPPGKFVSDMFVSQTTADVHGTYKDRGTAPGAGHDGHTKATIVLVKILPQGVAYQVFEHDNLGPWDQYKPSDFKPVAGNVVIK